MVFPTEVGVTMSLSAVIAERADALEREANALRKLDEAARELGEEQVRALLAPMLNGNGYRKEAVAETVAAAETPERAADDPRGREAVRLIVQERPGLWTLVDLRAEMKRRGWFTSPKGVDIAVMRMCKNGEARRAGKGRYEFFVPEERTLL